MFMAQAEQRMLDAGAINITDMRYRIVREPFGIEFAAQADKSQARQALRTRGL